MSRKLVTADFCLSDQFIKSGGNKYACVRNDHLCCQALCTKGTRCQKKAKYIIPVGKIPLYGGEVTKFMCETLNIVKLRSEECCQVCPIHLKQSSITLLQFGTKRVCSYIINQVVSGLFDQLKQEIGIEDSLADEYEQANEFMSDYSY